MKTPVFSSVYVSKLASTCPLREREPVAKASLEPSTEAPPNKLTAAPPDPDWLLEELKVELDSVVTVCSSVDP